jgi:chromatin modification-related protein VID21
VKEQPKKVINVHESHMVYLSSAVGTPFELVEAKFQRDMREARERQARLQQMNEARQQVVRQQQQMMSQQQQQQAAAQGGPMPQPGQQLPPGAQQAQMRPPGQVGQPAQGPPRIAPNGQAMPNMAPSQQQLLTAVAAANAARQSAGPSANGTPVNVNRPLPNVAAAAAAQANNPQMQQQIQMLQAQQAAARQAAQAQQSQNRAASAGPGGTPHSQSSQLAASPYAHSVGELPNGSVDGMNGSPAMMHAAVGPHSSPSQGQIGTPGSAMGRVPSIPQAHLRVASAGSAGSPQMGAAQVQQQQGATSSPQLSQAAVQQIINQIQANGQVATPEAVKAFHDQLRRNVSTSRVRDA